MPVGLLEKSQDPSDEDAPPEAERRKKDTIKVDGEGDLRLAADHS